MGNYQLSYSDEAFVDDEIRQLLKKKAIEKATPNNVTICSPIGVVPKKNGKRRLIVDMRYLNRHVQAPRFRYEDTADLKNVVQQGDLTYSLDLEAGFHHVSVHPDSQHLLGIRWRGQLYRWKYSDCRSRRTYSRE